MRGLLRILQIIGGATLGAISGYFFFNLTHGGGGTAGGFPELRTMALMIVYGSVVGAVLGCIF